MPASLYYPDPQPPANSTFFPTQMDSASSSSMMAGNNPTEQLALQLALLQGGLQPEWSTGDSSRLDDSRLYNGSSFRGSLEDLKMPPQRKSQNMTECVPVPTSEHVAEIVGRQGKQYIIISGFIIPIFYAIIAPPPFPGIFGLRMFY